MNGWTTLNLRDLSRGFGGRAVLRSIALELSGPGVVGLIGDNGAGKTTLLRVIAGILRPDAGEVRLFAEGLAAGSPEALRRLGALLERPGHYDELTVRDNLRHFYSFYRAMPAEELETHVTERVERLGLKAAAEMRVGELSTGYRQRLAIARAAHPWAEVVLLDEPFESLDPRARAEIKSFVRALREEGRLVVFSSHQLADVEQICDSLLLLSGGRLHRFESFQEVRRLVGDPGTGDLERLYTELNDRLSAVEAA